MASVLKVYYCQRHSLVFEDKQSQDRRCELKLVKRRYNLNIFFSASSFHDIFTAHYFIDTSVAEKGTSSNINICTADTICNLFPCSLQRNMSF